jgi:hypothetical protein
MRSCSKSQSAQNKTSLEAAGNATQLNSTFIIARKPAQDRTTQWAGIQPEVKAKSGDDQKKNGTEKYFASRWHPARATELPKKCKLFYRRNFVTGHSPPRMPSLNQRLCRSARLTRRHRCCRGFMTYIDVLLAMNLVVDLLAMYIDLARCLNT